MLPYSGQRFDFPLHWYERFASKIANDSRLRYDSRSFQPDFIVCQTMNVDLNCFSPDSDSDSEFAIAISYCVC